MVIRITHILLIHLEDVVGCGLDLFEKGEQLGEIICAPDDNRQTYVCRILNR